MNDDRKFHPGIGNISPIYSLEHATFKIKEQQRFGRRESKYPFRKLKDGEFFWLYDDADGNPQLKLESVRTYCYQWGRKLGCRFGYQREEGDPKNASSVGGWIIYRMPLEAPAEEIGGIALYPVGTLKPAVPTGGSMPMGYVDSGYKVGAAPQPAPVVPPVPWPTAVPQDAPQDWNNHPRAYDMDTWVENTTDMRNDMLTNFVVPVSWAEGASEIGLLAKAREDVGCDVKGRKVSEEWYLIEKEE